MKLLCPTCQKPLEVPEQYAGQMMKCPLCSNTFTVPVLAQMPSAPPPPPPKQEAASTKPMKKQAAAEAPVPRTPGQGRTLTINPRLVPWLAPLSLIGIFVLLFLPWVGMYPGGVGVVTQNGWQAAGGWAEPDPKFADNVTDARAQYWKDYLGTDLDPIRKPGASLMLIFFILIIIPAALTALLVLALHLKILPIELPAALAPFWPMRSLFVGGLALASLIFLLVGMLSGFPLEQKIATQVESLVKTKQEAAPPAERNEAQRWDIEKGIRQGGFCYQSTFWVTLALILNIVAVIGSGLELWTERRGPQALPRLEFGG